MILLSIFKHHSWFMTMRDGLLQQLWESLWNNHQHTCSKGFLAHLRTTGWACRTSQQPFFHPLINHRLPYFCSPSLGMPHLRKPTASLISSPSSPCGSCTPSWDHIPSHPQGGQRWPTVNPTTKRQQNGEDLWMMLITQICCVCIQRFRSLPICDWMGFGTISGWNSLLPNKFCFDLPSTCSSWISGKKKTALYPEQWWMNHVPLPKIHYSWTLSKMLLCKYPLRNRIWFQKNQQFSVPLTNLAPSGRYQPPAWRTYHSQPETNLGGTWRYLSHHLFGYGQPNPMEPSLRLASIYPNSWCLPVWHVVTHHFCSVSEVVHPTSFPAYAFTKRVKMRSGTQSSCLWPGCWRSFGQQKGTKVSCLSLSLSLSV